MEHLLRMQKCHRLVKFGHLLSYDHDKGNCLDRVEYKSFLICQLVMASTQQLIISLVKPSQAESQYSHLRTIITSLTKQIEDVNVVTPSANQPIFAQRLSPKLSYFRMVIVDDIVKADRSSNSKQSC